MLNEVWSHFDPFDALACALCRRRIKFLVDVSVLSDVRFSNMGAEWGEYHFHLLLEYLLFIPSLCYFDVSLTMLMGDAQFASVSAKKD